MFFKTLDVRQGRTVIPERWDTNEVILTLSQLITLRQFVGCDTVLGSPGRAGQTPRVEFKMRAQVDQGT